MAPSLHQRVLDLQVEHPDWIPILRAACRVAGRISEDAAFAGSWVLQDYASVTGASPNRPGLRRLVAFGLIEPTGVTSRGGKRAYYRMEHRAEIERILDEIGA